MPFDLVSAEPAAQSIPQSKSSPLMAAMKSADRALVSPLRRFGGNKILPAMMIAGAALLIPPAAKAQESPLYGEPWANSPWREVNKGEDPQPILTDLDFRWNRPGGSETITACNVQVRNHSQSDITVSKFMVSFKTSAGKMESELVANPDLITIPKNNGYVGAGVRSQGAFEGCDSVFRVYAFDARYVENPPPPGWTPWYPVQIGEPPNGAYDGLVYRWSKFDTSGSTACNVQVRNLKNYDISLSKLEIDFNTNARTVQSNIFSPPIRVPHGEKDGWGVLVIPGVKGNGALGGCDSVKNVFAFGGKSTPAGNETSWTITWTTHDETDGPDGTVRESTISVSGDMLINKWGERNIHGSEVHTGRIPLTELRQASIRLVDNKIEFSFESETCPIKYHDTGNMYGVPLNDFASFCADDMVFENATTAANALRVIKSRAGIAEPR